MKIKNLLIVNLDLENDNYVGRMYWNRYHYFKSRQGAKPVWDSCADSSLTVDKAIVWDCKTVEECVFRTKDSFIRRCLSWVSDHEGIDPEPLPLTLQEIITAKIDYADVGVKNILSSNTVAIYFIEVDTEEVLKTYGWNY